MKKSQTKIKYPNNLLVIAPISQGVNYLGLIIIGFILYFFTYCEKIYCQIGDPISLDNNLCSGRLNIQHPKYYKQYPFLKYSDFINKYILDSFPESRTAVVFSRHGLVNITSRSSSPFKQSFEGKIGANTFQLNMYFSHYNEVLGNDTIIKDLMFNSLFLFQDKIKKQIIGEIPNETRFHYEKLDSVVLIYKNNKQLIWTSSKYEIININREYDVPNCPNIKLLYSKKHKKLFLYMAMKNYYFEKTYENNSYYPTTDFPSSRFKLIIDPFTGEFSTIFIGGQWLYLYGWDNCPNFWPF